MASDKSWDEQVRERVDDIRDETYGLGDLARAFHQTGNNRVHDEIMAAVNRIRRCLDAIGEAMTARSKALLAEARAEVGATLTALLTMGERTARDGEG